MKTGKKALLGMSIMLILTGGVGCQTFVQTALETWDFNTKMDSYEDHYRERGYSHKDAEYNAYYDYLWQENEY